MVVPLTDTCLAYGSTTCCAYSDCGGDKNPPQVKVNYGSPNHGVLRWTNGDVMKMDLRTHQHRGPTISLPLHLGDHGSSITSAAPGTKAETSAKTVPERLTAAAIGIGSPVASSMQTQVDESHLFTVPLSPPSPNSTAAQLASSISTTYKVPSGPSVR